MSRVYISDQCYVDRDNHQMVRFGTDGEISCSIKGKTWRFLERLVMSTPNELVTKEQMADYVHQGNYIDADLDGLRRFKSILKSIYEKQLLLDADEFDRIVCTSRGDGYRFQPQTTTPTCELSDAAFRYMSELQINKTHVLSMIDCMLFKGISGAMGRQEIFRQAKNNNCLAMFELGELYFYGFVGSKPDYLQAHEWYKKAADEYGHPGAAWSVAYMIVHNICPVVPKEQIDYAMALCYLNKAIGGHAENATASAAALTTLGELYQNGKYPAKDFSVQHPSFEPKDMDKAIRCYEQAAAKNYHFALNRLGRISEERKALKDAFEYYPRSAQLAADGYVYNKLGLAYEEGRGVTKDVDAACRWYLDSVNEVLEHDITPWGKLNAGRVYGGIVENQPRRYINLSRAFRLLFESMEALEPYEISQQITAVASIILRQGEQFSQLLPEDKQRTILRIKTFTELYFATDKAEPSVKRLVDQALGINGQ